MDLFNVIALDALRSLTAMDGTCNIEQNMVHFTVYLTFNTIFIQFIQIKRFMSWIWYTLLMRSIVT